MILLDRAIYSIPECEHEDPQKICDLRITVEGLEIRVGKRLVYSASFRMWALSMLYDNFPVSKMVPEKGKLITTTYADGRITHELVDQ
jgi:hypothetical protein